MASVPGVDLWVTDTGLTLDFNRTTDQSRKGHVVQVTLAGDTPGRSIGYQPRSQRINYLSGVADTPTSASVYAEAWVKEVTNGVDARYYFDKGSPRYDLIVRPGSDPNRISMTLAGARNVRIGSDNRLRYDTSLGTVVEQGLIAYQKSGNGTVRVPAAPVVRKDGSVSFRVGIYDRTKPLIIDPIIEDPVPIGTIAGGVMGLTAQAADGTSVLVGTTLSSSFPTTPGAYDTTFNGTDGTTRNGFVTRVDSDGNVLWTTFFGQNLNVIGVALDSANQPVITGSTNRHSFTPTTGAFDTEFNGDTDGFVAKLTADGTAVVWSTFIGGFTKDEIEAVAIGADDVVYVAGTGGSTYPVSPGCYDPSYNYSNDAVVSVLSADGSTLLASTYIGSSQNDIAYDIAVDSVGDIVVAGQTKRRTFPVTTSGVLDSSYGGGSEGFVAKLSPDLTTLHWSTFVGGELDDSVMSIAVASEDSIVVGGTTKSLSGMTYLEGARNGLSDAFVLKLSSSGTALGSPTTGRFLGGDGSESIGNVGISPDGQIVVTGATDSPSGLGTIVTSDAAYPTRSPGDTGTTRDAYVVRLSADAKSLIYGSLMGVPGDDEGRTFTELNSVLHVFSRIDSAGTVQAAVSRVTLTTELSELSLSASSVVGTPGPLGQVTGTVKFNGNMSSDTNVALTCTNPNATVPASVTVPAGSNVATFTVTTSETTSATVGEITASYDSVSLTSEITVSPVTVSINLSQPNLVANFGRKLAATIQLGQAVGHDVNLALVSNDVHVKVPASVKVLAGSTQASFQLTSGYAILDPITVTIDGTYGSMVVSTTLDLLPPDIASVSLSPDTLKGFEKTLVTVTFNNPVPADGQALPRRIVWAAGPLEGNQAGVKIAAYLGSNVAPAGATSYTCEIVAKPTTKDNLVYARVGSVFSNLLTIRRPRVEGLTASPDDGPGPRTCTATITLDSAAPVGGMTVFIGKTLGSLIVLPSTTVTVLEGQKRASFSFDVLAVGTDRFGQIMARTSTDDSWTIKPITLRAPTIKAVIVGNGGAKAGATFNMRITITSEARIGGLKIALAEDGTSYLSLPVDPDNGNPGIEVDGGDISKIFPVTISSSAPVGTVINGTATLNGQVVPFTVTVYP